jgi:hypothetical protein
MNKEKQRIAIAEACGYRPATPGALGVLRWHDPHHQNGDLGNGICYIDELPDYLKDLNATQSAENTLSVRDKQGYISILRNICTVAGCWPETATAAQRAEAFLKALNLWKEEA